MDKQQSECRHWNSWESRHSSPHPEKNPSVFYLHTQEQMCPSPQSMFLNTNKKAAAQGHRPKRKSHFPASDAAISTLTLTLAPQLWWSSHYGRGKEIVPRWEVNYLAWHKNVEKANSTCFSLGKIFLFKYLPATQFCLLCTHSICMCGNTQGIYELHHIPANSVKREV